MNQHRQAEKDDHLAFGPKVRSYREGLGLSLRQFSDVTKVNRGTLSAMERGIRNLPEIQRLNVVDVLANAYPPERSETIRDDLLTVSDLPAPSAALKDEPFSSVLAEEFCQRQEWHNAANHWTQAAWLASSTCNWYEWAKCTLNAGMMYLHLGTLEDAERLFQAVSHRPKHLVGIEAVAEASIRGSTPPPDLGNFRPS